VAMGRAAARDPAAFLFDEPLAAIDVSHRLQLRGELAARFSGCGWRGQVGSLPSAGTGTGTGTGTGNGAGPAWVYVTHDFAEAMVLGTRVAVMDGGRVLQVGDPAGVYRQPADLRVAEIFGARGINLWPGGDEVLAGLGWARSGLAGGSAGGFTRGGAEAVTLGVRPEDVAIVRDGLGDFQAQVVGCEDLGGEVWLRVVVSAVGGDVGRSVGAEKEGERWWIRGGVGQDWRVQGRQVQEGLSRDGMGGVPRIGERVGLKVARERLHVFGATTGRNLGKEFNEAQ
jgi:ABC-type sugar transport system ATPase subunit